MSFYIGYQNEVIEEFGITICDGSLCEDDWSRTHAHVQKRMVCKWKQVNSIQSTFILFHEIGHIVNNNSKMRRCEAEYYATIWAIVMMERYKLQIPDKTLRKYQTYINMEHDRGVRRGGKLPALSLLQLI